MSNGGWGRGPVIDISGGKPVFNMPELPKVPLRTIGIVLVGLAVMILLFTGYYQVEPDQVGDRAAASARTCARRSPGPHFKIPFGIETVTKVPVQRQLKMEFGFRTTRAGVAHRVRAADSPELIGESLMLTGDLNVAVVEWIVQYRIKDPQPVPLPRAQPRRHLPRT